MSGSAGDLLARVGAWLREARARDLLADAVLQPAEAALHAAQASGIERPAGRLLVIMLCGPTAVGKSSLLNALAGAAIAPTGLGATTTAPLIYLHEDDDPARLFGYGQALGALAADGIGVVRHTLAALRGKAVVDTPDIDSAVRTHRAITEAAVATADVVLAVTSPEKYKVEAPLRWLAAQRRRRGLAFVLDKWDADGMGMQFARRQRVADDFRALIEGFGFADPFLFLVSVRDRPDSDGARGFAQLQDWLQAGLDAATAADIFAWRRRAGWGEIAAALTAALPALAGSNDDIRHVERAVAEAVAAARDIVQADAARLAAVPAPIGFRPQSPGLFGWAVAGLRLPRLAYGIRGPAAPPGDAAFGNAPFGRDALAGLCRATADLELFARTLHVRLGTVPAAWADLLDRLAHDLADIPARAEAQALAASLRARVRRGLARLWLGVVEVAIAGVLALTLWRLVGDFIDGRYAPFALLGSAAGIVLLVALFGQLGVRLLFPALSARIAALARQRANGQLDAATTALAGALTGQIEAAVRLRESGAALLTQIDCETSALAAQSGHGTAARLFADQPADPPGGA